MQPPSTPSAPDQPLYEAFFGLREQPFALTTDPKFLFMSASHRRAFEELLTGLRRREGLLLLTGETGMGKTTLCRAVIDALGHRTFSALILNPYMSDAEVLRVILRDFGLVSRDEIRKGAFAKADMPQLLDTLEAFLRTLIPLNSYAVVIIDEAQSLPPKVLDQIRMLGGYEQDGQRLLQIILVGQPGLLTTLRSDAMQALDGRVSRRAVLGALPPAEVDTYIQHRLSVAGGKDSVGFPSDSVNTIAQLTRGVPRRINLLCDRALEEGRVAGTNVITARLVQQAARAGGNRTAPGDETADGLSDLALQFEHEVVTVDRSLMFGQMAAADETAAPPKTRRLLVATAFIVVALAAAAGYYAWATVDTAPGTTPEVPEAPPKVYVVPAPLPLPTDDEMLSIMQELERSRQGPQPER